MNWVLQAAGEVDREITDPKVWAAIEDELGAALHEVLSQSRFGTTFSLLGLRLTQGPVHKAGQPLAPVAPSLPEPEPEQSVQPADFGGPEQQPPADQGAPEPDDGHGGIQDPEQEPTSTGE